MRVHTVVDYGHDGASADLGFEFTNFFMNFWKYNVDVRYVIMGSNGFFNEVKY